MRIELDDIGGLEWDIFRITTLTIKGWKFEEYARYWHKPGFAQEEYGYYGDPRKKGSPEFTLDEAWRAQEKADEAG